MAHFQFPHFYCPLSMGKETFALGMTDSGTGRHLPLIYFVYVQLWSNVGVVCVLGGVACIWVCHLMRWYIKWHHFFFQGKFKNVNVEIQFSQRSVYLIFPVIQHKDLYVFFQSTESLSIAVPMLQNILIT